MEETLTPLPGDNHVLAMLTGSGPVVQFVLWLLILLSVLSWAVAIAKFLQFRKARRESNEFSTLFWETRNLSRVDDSSRRLSASPLVQVFASGYRELSHILQEAAKPKEQRSGLSASGFHTVEQALKRAELQEAYRLEKGITFLATVASAAPFIGLFGTVWGIMNAFHGLSSIKTTTLQAVAPGISEALVATAIGLAAAIPAAVAYNYFAVAVRRFKELMDGFSKEFIDLAAQQWSPGGSK